MARPLCYCNKSLLPLNTPQQHNMQEFKALINKKIHNLFLVVWSPWGEEESHIDIAFGFVFEDNLNSLCLISIDKDEIWSPHIYYQSIPQNAYMWKDFYARMRQWMAAEDDEMIMGFEYYDVSKCELFENIVGSQIISIEEICLKDTPEPFGVKLSFEKDYIISLPVSDGNTVETSLFNQHKHIDGFKRMGEIEYKLIS